MHFKFLELFGFYQDIEFFDNKEYIVLWAPYTKGGYKGNGLGIKEKDSEEINNWKINEEEGIIL